MKINIGDKIKTLRKARDITQEELAEYLGCSFQSVSKWERGDGYPDIELVPAIARFFGVTTDEMLGVDKQKDEDRINEYDKRFNELLNKGDVEGQVTLMREAVVQYPGNFLLMSNLMYAISWQADKNDKDNEKSNEVIQIAKKILSDCKEDTHRYAAMQVLSGTLVKVGKREEAIDMVKSHLPSMNICQPVILAKILEGENQLEQIQINIRDYMDKLTTDLVSLAYARVQKDGKKDFYYSNDEKIEFVELAIKIYKLLFPKNDYIFYLNRLWWFDSLLAILNMKANQPERAIDYINEGAINASAFDDLSEESKHISPVFNKLVNKQSEHGRKRIETDSQLFLEEMNNKVFDPIRTDTRFLAAQTMLQSRTGKT